jgi:hypothetical protein
MSSFTESIVEEAALGSNPASALSTPEVLEVPGTCSDGADNDGDAATDLADSGCQLPLHDIAIRKVNGETSIGGASECQPNAPSGCGTTLRARRGGGRRAPCRRP